LSTTKRKSAPIGSRLVARSETAENRIEENRRGRRRARGRGRRRAAVRDVHLGWASPDSRRGRPRARRPRRARAHVPDHGRTRERASGAHAVAGDGKVVEPVEGALAAARRGGGTGRRERAGVAAPRATRAEARGRERARRVSSARGLARRAKAPAREERRGARAGRPETRTRTRTRTRGDAFPRFRRARDRTARRFVGIVARGRGRTTREASRGLRLGGADEGNSTDPRVLRARGARDFISRFRSRIRARGGDDDAVER
jgi:hypothetical protein